MHRKRRPKKITKFSLYEFRGDFGTLRVMARTPGEGAEIAREILSKLEIYKGEMDLISAISFPDFARRR